MTKWLVLTSFVFILWKCQVVTGQVLCQNILEQLDDQPVEIEVGVNDVTVFEEYEGPDPGNRIKLAKICIQGAGAVNVTVSSQRELSTLTNVTHFSTVEEDGRWFLCVDGRLNKEMYQVGNDTINDGYLVFLLLNATPERNINVYVKDINDHPPEISRFSRDDCMFPEEGFLEQKEVHVSVLLTPRICYSQTSFIGVIKCMSLIMAFFVGFISRVLLLINNQIL